MKAGWLPAAAHTVFLGLVFLLLWDIVPASRLIVWASAVLVVLGTRVVLSRRLLLPTTPPRVRARAMRAVMAALGLAWGVGAAIIVREVPTAAMAILLLGLAGLLAGGLATLVADRWVFPLYAVAMFGPLLFSLPSLHNRLNDVAIMMVAVFLAFMVRLHQGAHRALALRLRVEEDLRNAVAEVKVLRGILPICATCKRIRNEDGSWEPVDSFVLEHTNAEFSHGLCPDCAKEIWGASAS